MQMACANQEKLSPPKEIYNFLDNLAGETSAKRMIA